MSNAIFQEGGPLRTHKVGPDKYEMSVDLSPDEDGMVGRECQDETCSPGYFKVTPGTGITEGQTVAYCPYCRYQDDPGAFFTKAQKEYVIKLVENETINGINQMIGNALGLGPSGRKKYGSGMFSIEMSYKPDHLAPVARRFEEELRRDITCPYCGLVHSVFGLATWCPDCGKDIFTSHIEAELDVVRKVLRAVESRRRELGARVAARDIENGLEDVVSVFETVLKLITRRHLIMQGISPEEAEKQIEKIRNAYQNISTAADTFRKNVGLELFDGISDDEIDMLKLTFAKRHPITHNLGIIDRKYLDRVRTGEMKGREVRVTADEVELVLDSSLKVLNHSYIILFGSAT